MGRMCMNCGQILHKEATQCKHCNSTNVSELNSHATLGDYFVICKISKDPQFIKAMMELYDTDIIEFNLKISQFKQQIEQSSNNIPKCPNCNSTNINRISGLNRGASIVMFGIFSKKNNKSYECKSCGYTW